MALFELKRTNVDLTMHKPKEIQKENRHIVVHFETAKDLYDFSLLLDIPLTKKDKELFYDCNSIKSDKLIEPIYDNLEKPQPKQSWKYWWGMPEYISLDRQGYHMIYVYFKDKESKDNFISLINQQITPTTNYIWFPKKERRSRLAYTWMVDND